MATKAQAKRATKPADPAKVAPAAPQKPAATYMRGEKSPFFFSWKPALRDQGKSVLAGYVAAASRAMDALHNSGWLAGGVEQAISSTVGTGLRLALKPDIDELGWTPADANAWARFVERRWESWASDPMECDARATMTVHDMGAAALRSTYSHGENVALLPAIRRPWSTTRTKVKLVPAHHLTQDCDSFARLVQGVRLDEHEMPIGYRFCFRQPNGVEQKIDIAARDGAGRPQVIHTFESNPGQVRGISPLAPVLRVIRQFDQLADATLEAALLQTLFAATVQSEAPTEDVLRALQDEGEQDTGGLGGAGMSDLLGAKAAWYENTKIDLGRAGRIAHLFPGEKLELHGSKTPNDHYEAFARFLLREIARGLGITFEQLTGDYTGATYSSVRMSISEVWPTVLRRRGNVVGRMMQAIFVAWLEEEIETGRIPYPGGFYAFVIQRAAATRADWRGPPKPQADDLKTAKAHETYFRLGLATAETICADLGQDWEDVFEQRAREKEMREGLGLDEDQTIAPGAVSSPAPADQPDKEEQDARD